LDIYLFDDLLGDLFDDLLGDLFDDLLGDLFEVEKHEKRSIENRNGKYLGVGKNCA
jgi:hypothetical protein